MAKDTLGKVTSVDADGDAEVHFPKPNSIVSRWNLADSLNKLATHDGTAIKSKKDHGDVTWAGRMRLVALASKSKFGEMEIMGIEVFFFCCTRSSELIGVPRPRTT